MSESSEALQELASLGSATVYEASGRKGLVDVDLIQIVPGSAVAGPARTVRCGQGDNRAVHASIARLQPGEVLVLTMPEPAPVALVGELLVTQAKAHGAAALLVDASVRDVAELRELGLPVWARWVRMRGATKTERGTLDEPVTVGGARIASGDIVVLDADGAVVVERADVDRVLQASLKRQQGEAEKRKAFAAGEMSYDIYGMRAEDAATI